jgi:transposase
MNTTHPAQKRYPPELRERAVRMVFETMEREGERFCVITRIVRQLGIGTEPLRNWVRQAEVDRGERAGLTTDERRRTSEFEREVRELRRASEILKAASAFFARELDPRPPRWPPSSTRTARGSGSSRSASSCSSPGTVQSSPVRASGRIHRTSGWLATVTIWLSGGA